MKKIAIGAAAALAAATLLAAPAGATTQPEQDFLRDVHAQGFPATLSDSEAVDMGHRVCEQHKQGVTLEALQAQAVRVLTPRGYTRDNAEQFIPTALAALCPDEYQKELHRILDGHLTVVPVPSS